MIVTLSLVTYDFLIIVLLLPGGENNIAVSSIEGFVLEMLCFNFTFSFHPSLQPGKYEKGQHSTAVSAEVLGEFTERIQWSSTYFCRSAHVCQGGPDHPSSLLLLWLHSYQSSWQKWSSIQLRCTWWCKDHQWCQSGEEWVSCRQSLLKELVWTKQTYFPCQSMGAVWPREKLGQLYYIWQECS